MPSNLRVVQFNVENLFLKMGGKNNFFSPTMTEAQWQSLAMEGGPNKSLAKLKWLAQEIELLDADLLILQEVGGLESLENFNKLFLANQYVPLLIEGNSDRNIHLGFLLNKNNVCNTALISHKDHPLTMTSAPAAPGAEVQSPTLFSRDVLELRLLHPVTQAPLAFILNVHLKSKWNRKGHDIQGRGQRAAELRGLLEIHKKLIKAFPSALHIVAGDFNGTAAPKTLQAPEFTPLHTDSQLIDVFDFARVPINARATLMTFNSGGGAGSGGPGPVDAGCERRDSENLKPRTAEDQTEKPQSLPAKHGIQIDHIFVNQAWAEKLDLTQTRVHMFSSRGAPLGYAKSATQKSAMPSDHHPVVAVFRNFWPAS